MDTGRTGLRTLFKLWPWRRKSFSWKRQNVKAKAKYNNAYFADDEYATCTASLRRIKPEGCSLKSDHGLRDSYETRKVGSAGEPYFALFPLITAYIIAEGTAANVDWMSAHTVGGIPYFSGEGRKSAEFVTFPSSAGNVLNSLLFRKSAEFLTFPDSALFR